MIGSFFLARQTREQQHSSDGESQHQLDAIQRVINEGLAQSNESTEAGQPAGEAKPETTPQALVNSLTFALDYICYQQTYTFYFIVT